MRKLSKFSISRQNDTPRNVNVERLALACIDCGNKNMPYGVRGEDRHQAR